jgi:hypothetical protein
MRSLNSSPILGEIRAVPVAERHVGETNTAFQGAHRIDQIASSLKPLPSNDSALRTDQSCAPPTMSRRMWDWSTSE